MRIAFLQCGFVKQGFDPAAFDDSNVGQFFPFQTSPYSTFNPALSHIETMSLEDAVKMIFRIKSWTLSGTLTRFDGSTVALSGTYPAQYQDATMPTVWSNIPNEQFFCHVNGIPNFSFPCIRICYSVDLEMIIGISSSTLILPLIAFMDTVTPGYIFESNGSGNAGGIGELLNTAPSPYPAGSLKFNFGGNPIQLFFKAPSGSQFLDATLTPEEWWEYRDSTGANPIYDSSNGTQLIFPLPTGL